MRLPEVLPIVPFTRPARGRVGLPGSKSITNRALLLAALCDGPVTLTGALFSEDTAIMAEALRKLGFDVRENPAAATIEVQGWGGKIPAREADLHVGLAGTAARFLTALCAAAPSGAYRLDGVPQMRKRPMKGLIEALRAQGAAVTCEAEEGFFPLAVAARGLAGGPVSIDAEESSQMLSALLMVAPLAAEPTEVSLSARVREPFVAMTRELMRQFGVETRQGPSGPISVPRGRYRRPQGAYAVEPDATAASYFAALPLVAGGSLEPFAVIPGSIQGDAAFPRVLTRAGLVLDQVEGGFAARYSGGPRPGLTEDFSPFSDTFLTLAAIAPLLESPTRITGIAHTRKQETDRVGNMAKELRRLGQDVAETEDSLTIHPRPLKPEQTVETYGDHRFAMSFGVLGCHNLHGDGRPWLAIRNPACCAKTFPAFFDELEKARLGSLSPT